ncbi:MAG: diguanylate cyclase [Lachnospiraceae bacterium]|nr:diguanylate cyclase [Lachnospiraceae bacterium]
MKFDSFKWVNESKAEYKDGVLKVYAPEKTDYFNSPVKENGAFGHAAGDALIKSAAKILSQAFDGKGVIGRMGGADL